MITARGFNKTFSPGLTKRRVVAAEAIDLEVEGQEVHGFLGPNGSGKTTTIKALLGLIRPTSGHLSILGEDPRSGAWRGRVGYMPEHPTFPDFLTGRELVSWHGRLAGRSAHEADQQAAHALGRVGLGHALDRRIRQYSKGMTQRAGLAQALMGRPELLILDEPMTGLDPMGRKEIRELILQLADEGLTIFYSTHILPDVEMTCSQVTIVNKGRTLTSGKLTDIMKEHSAGVSVTVDWQATEVRSAELGKLSDVHVEGDRVRALLPGHDEARAYLAHAQAAGAILVRYEPHRPDLETVFVEALEQSKRAEAVA